MPYYDYKCPSCEKDMELFHSIVDDAPKCPECGGELKRAYNTAPPDLGSSIRIQGGIDQMRTNIHNKYLK